MPGQESRTRDRSISLDGELESDLESHGDTREGSSAPGKPGRKKNPNSQAARRDQNRIAQREFRLRKQQRIRDLEARVELLSGGKDEAMGEMRNVLKDLMAENQNLRNMLRNLATFIGEGLGGVLPKLGWDLNDFNTFVNKGETDTAWEGFQQRKKQMHQTQAEAAVVGTSVLPPILGQKRSLDDGPLSGRSKKARGDDNEGGRPTNGFNNLISPATSSSTLYTQDSRATGNAMFSDMMRGSTNSDMFSQSSPSSNSSLPYGNVPGNMGAYQNSYMGGITMPPLNQAMPQAPYETQNASSQPRSAQISTPVSPDENELDDDPNKSEALKLIHYHLENYKRNSSYCLPSSLRPTVGQRAVPHESVIDSILHPELRDKLIYNRQSYELAECLVDFRRAVTIHGDDVLAHSNWEISEPFFRKYPFLVDSVTLELCNRWRKDRGEPPLRIDDYTTPTPA